MKKEMAEQQGAILNGYNKALAEMDSCKKATGRSEKHLLTFDFLQKHVIMLMAHTFNFDWNKNVLKLFQPMDHVMANIMDADIVK